MYLSHRNSSSNIIACFEGVNYKSGLLQRYRWFSQYVLIAKINYLCNRSTGASAKNEEACRKSPSGLHHAILDFEIMWSGEPLSYTLTCSAAIVHILTTRRRVIVAIRFCFVVSPFGSFVGFSDSATQMYSWYNTGMLVEKPENFDIVGVSNNKTVLLKYVNFICARRKCTHKTMQRTTMRM